MLRAVTQKMLGTLVLLMLTAYLWWNFSLIP